MNFSLIVTVCVVCWCARCANFALSNGSGLVTNKKSGVSGPWTSSVGAGKKLGRMSETVLVMYYLAPYTTRATPKRKTMLVCAPGMAARSINGNRSRRRNRIWQRERRSRKIYAHWPSLTEIKGVITSPINTIYLYHMAQAIEAYAPRFIARLHAKYLHNVHIFNGQWAKNLEQSSPIAAKFNNSMW